MAGSNRQKLLDLSLGSCCFDLLFDLFSFFLGGAFLDGLRSALNESLGLGKPESWDCGTHFLDDADLIGSDFLQDDIKGGLLLNGSSGSGGASSGNSDWSGGANAPLLFKGLYEVSDLKNCQVAELIY